MISGRFAVWTGVVAGALAVAGCIPPPGGVMQDYEATLDGDQEVPPVQTNGTGEGTFTRRDNVLEFRITASGLTGPVVGAHFHDGPAGADGLVVFNLFPFLEEENGNVTVMGEWDLDAGDITAVEDGSIYVNLHTAQFPDGEIRGQLDLVP